MILTFYTKCNKIKISKVILMIMNLFKKYNKIQILKVIMNPYNKIDISKSSKMIKK